MEDNDKNITYEHSRKDAHINDSDYEVKKSLSSIIAYSEEATIKDIDSARSSDAYHKSKNLNETIIGEINKKEEDITYETFQYNAIEMQRKKDAETLEQLRNLATSSAGLVSGDLFYGGASEMLNSANRDLANESNAFKTEMGEIRKDFVDGYEKEIGTARDENIRDTLSAVENEHKNEVANDSFLNESSQKIEENTDKIAELEAIKANLASEGKDTSQLDSGIANLKEENAQINTKAEDYKKDLDDKFNERYDNLKENLAGSGTDFDKKYNNVVDQFDNINGKERDEKSETSVQDDLTKFCENQERESSTAKNELKDALKLENENITQIDGTIERNKAKISELEDKIAYYEEKKKQVSGDDKNRSNGEAYDKAIGKLSSDIAKLKDENAAQTKLKDQALINSTVIKDKLNHYDKVDSFVGKVNAVAKQSGGKTDALKERVKAANERFDKNASKVKARDKALRSSIHSIDQRIKKSSQVGNELLYRNEMKAEAKKMFSPFIKAFVINKVLVFTLFKAGFRQVGLGGTNLTKFSEKLNGVALKFANNAETAGKIARLAPALNKMSIASGKLGALLTNTNKGFNVFRKGVNKVLNYTIYAPGNLIKKIQKNLRPSTWAIRGVKAAGFVAGKSVALVGRGVSKAVNKYRNAPERVQRREIKQQARTQKKEHKKEVRKEKFENSKFGKAAKALYNKAKAAWKKFNNSKVGKFVTGAVGFPVNMLKKLFSVFSIVGTAISTVFSVLLALVGALVAGLLGIVLLIAFWYSMYTSIVNGITTWSNMEQENTYVKNHPTYIVESALEYRNKELKLFNTLTSGKKIEFNSDPIYYNIYKNNNIFESLINRIKDKTVKKTNETAKSFVEKLSGSISSDTSLDTILKSNIQYYDNVSVRYQDGDGNSCIYTDEDGNIYYYEISNARDVLSMADALYQKDTENMQLVEIDKYLGVDNKTIIAADGNIEDKDNLFNMSHKVTYYKGTSEDDIYFHEITSNEDEHCNNYDKITVTTTSSSTLTHGVGTMDNYFRKTGYFPSGTAFEGDTATVSVTSRFMTSSVKTSYNSTYDINEAFYRQNFENCFRKNTVAFNISSMTGSTAGIKTSTEFVENISSMFKDISQSTSLPGNLFFFKDETSYFVIDSTGKCYGSFTESNCTKELPSVFYAIKTTSGYRFFLYSYTKYVTTRYLFKYKYDFAITYNCAGHEKEFTESTSYYICKGHCDLDAVVTVYLASNENSLYDLAAQLSDFDGSDTRWAKMWWWGGLIASEQHAFYPSISWAKDSELRKIADLKTENNLVYSVNYDMKKNINNLDEGLNYTDENELLFEINNNGSIYCVYHLESGIQDNIEIYSIDGNKVDEKYAQFTSGGVYRTKEEVEN